MIRTSEEAFTATDDFVTVGPEIIARLKAEVAATTRKRVRICLHKSVDDRLHEFFIIYTDKTAIQPHKHMGKDESMTLLEGEADVVFYNDQGDVQKIISIGAPWSGKPFYARIPADTYHTLVMKSESLVLFVATPGPFHRDHTKWAEWAK